MALPNGDLITTPFDPQMAYPSDRRMQVDTLNSRDSMSMFIRWEGMEVYVLETSKKYILQGGRSNEYWKESGTGMGTGGTTFVGQFPTADLLPTSGRSAGDYAFVGTGDDFVQYNWDNIANEWVMAEGQTDMASEFFHIGYKTPLRRPVIFPLFPKDVLVQESGDFVFAPETAVARFIFVGEVTAIRGIETAAADREIKLVNRTGSDIPLRDKASGIPSDSGFDFGGTDYTWLNGSEITLKGNGTYWELAPNNQVAFSDHLDSVNAQVSVGSDGKITISGIYDKTTSEYITFKEVDNTPDIDGVMYVNYEDKTLKRVAENGVNIKWFGAIGDGVADDTTAFQKALLFAKNYYWAVTLLIPEGRYRVNNRLLVDYNKCRIRGEGKGLSVVEYYYEQQNVGSTYYLERDQSCFVTPDEYIENLEFRDFTIEYKGTYHIPDPLNYYSHGFGAISGILIRKVRGVKLLGMEVLGFNDCGVRFDTIQMPSDYGDTYNVELTGSIFHRNHFANVHARNVNGFNATNCDFHEAGYGLAANLVGTTGYGLAFSSYNGNFSKNIIVSGNRFYDNNRKGLDSHGCGDIYVNGNVFSGNRATQCALFYNSGTIQVHGNTFKNHVELPTFSGKPAYRFVSLDLGRQNSVTEEGFANYKFSIQGNIFKEIDIVGGNNFSVIGCLTDASKLNLSLIGNIIDAENVATVFNFSSQVNSLGRENIATIIGNTITVSERCLIGGFLLQGFERYVISNNEININAQGVSLNGETNPPRNPFNFLDINISGIVKEITYVGNSLSGSKWDGVSFSDPLDANFIPIDAFATLSGVNRNAKVIADHNWLNSIKDSLSDYQKYFQDNKLSGSGIPVYTGTDVTFVSSGPSTYIRGDGQAAAINPAVRSVPLLGTAPLNSKITETDTVLVGFNKAQGQINFLSSYVFREDREVDTGNATFSSADVDKYVRFTGGVGNVNIVLDRFSAGVELVGEIEGSQKTFTGDAGVTLRYPDGQDLVAPTGSKFIIKFKSPNDALVTIIKPYVGTGATMFPALTDTPSTYTSQKNKTVKVNNEESALVFVADGVDVRDITDGGSIAPTLTSGFMGSRLNFTSSTAVTLQGFTSADGQSSVTLVNPHATNNLTLVHNGSGTVKYIDAGSTDLVIAPKTAVKLEIVGNEIYRVL